MIDGRFGRHLRAFVFVAVAMFSIQSQAGVNERFMQVHREWCFASHGYEEKIAKELHVPLEVVQDFFNAYSLYLTQGVVLATTQSFLNDYPQWKHTMVSMFLVHRLLFWGSSAALYLWDKPLSFLTHAFLYQSILWSANLLPHWIDWQLNNGASGSQGSSASVSRSISSLIDQFTGKK